MPVKLALRRTDLGSRGQYSPCPAQLVTADRIDNHVSHSLFDGSRSAANESKTIESEGSPSIAVHEGSTSPRAWGLKQFKAR